MMSETSLTGGFDRDGTEAAPYDVVVIGAGVAGCCCARELARYDARVVVLEAGDDIACGATRANSGIVHAGYDPEPGTAKARYNVAGAALFPTWASELKFAYARNESLVVGFDEADRASLEGLLERGRQNGVEGLELIDGDEARVLEPALSGEVTCALRVRTGAICDPYEVALSALENAVRNGVEVRFDARVCDIARPGNGVFDLVLAGGEVVRARAIVNAAGVHSAQIHNLLSASKLKIVPVRGEYLLYDPRLGSTFARTVFQVPTAKGKGVLVSPTVHGNLFVGPSATEQDDPDALGTSAAGLAGIVEGARRTWPGASARDAITNFAGVRAKGTNHDFVIGACDDVPGLFDVACLESPGLTSSPAVGVEIASQVGESLGLARRADFWPTNPPRRRLAYMSAAEREEAIAKDPAWGEVVCRCGNVSAAEVVAALHGPVPVLCLDALKWRAGAMMGRCHGGFCTPELLRVVSAELGVAPQDVDKRLRGSWMVASARPDYVELARGERKARKGDATSADASGAPADGPYDVLVVGGGAAGMAAATSARERGAARVLLVDRASELGGIMCQCVHNGFGLKRYKDELTGPEFAAREAEELARAGVEVWDGATVLSLHVTDDGAPSTLEVVRPRGSYTVRARAVVLACGSRERGFGALGIVGDRPSGIYTAGSAQSLINLQGCVPGHRAVILGSGDIGLIMARRMTLEGMEVEGVYELLDHPSGLTRNIVQCLDDFGIPLHLSHTVVATHGSARLESVDIAEVDPATRRPIPGTEVNVACDTLVLSCGLIPQSELAREAGIEISPVTGGAVVNERLETSAPGVFACGNALHVHDLADFAAAEGALAGEAAAAWVASGARGASDPTPVEAGAGVRYVVPSRIDGAGSDPVTLAFRPSKVMRGARFVIEARRRGDVTELASRRLKVALPAEMCRVAVRPPTSWDEVEGVEVRIEGDER